MIVHFFSFNEAITHTHVDTTIIIIAENSNTSLPLSLAKSREKN